MSGWRMELETDPAPELRDAILRPLAAHNERQAGPGNWSLLAITVRDAAGQVAGGLWGRCGYGFLFVELLALGEARGQGLGRQVMALAEAEARRRGLSGIWLDSWTFQAPEFYRRLGFEEFGRIPDHPPGQDRVFLMKQLVPT